MGFLGRLGEPWQVCHDYVFPARQGRCISRFLRGAVRSSPRPPLRYCLEAEQEPSLMIVSLHLDSKRLSYVRETH